MHPTPLPAAAVALILVSIQWTPSPADVTIQQETTIHALIVKAHGTSTDRITGDKQRSERQFSCDGVMSMFCGHKKNVEIVRVDRGLTRSFDPKRKRYTEIGG